MLLKPAPATPLRSAGSDLFQLQVAPKLSPASLPEFVFVDFIYIGVAPPGRETDLEVEGALLHILPGVKRPAGRFRSLRRTESQAFVMLGVALVALGAVRSRRRRYPVVESRRRLAA